MLIDEGRTKARITIGYKEGKGDGGISKVCSECSLPKYSSSTILNVYMELDHLRALIGDVLKPNLVDILLSNKKGKLRSLLQWTMTNLLGYRIRDKKLTNLLEWLRNDSFSIGALLALGGNSTRHQFNRETLVKLEQYIQANKEVTGDCKDFLIHEGYLAKLDSIRVSIRRLEAFLNQAQVDIGSSAELELCTAIVNRLSSALFWAIRKEYKLAGEKEKYWTGNRTELSL